MIEGGVPAGRHDAQVESEWRSRSWWGWGYEAGQLGDSDIARLRSTAGALLGLDGTVAEVPAVGGLRLAEPRCMPPETLAGQAATDDFARALHAYGCSYRDVVRSLSGVLEHPPDFVFFPRSEADVARAMDWCSSESVALIPYGGGSSVVGGIEPDVGEEYRGTVSLDLAYMNAVQDIDRMSCSARIEGGCLGPELERGLGKEELTLRHFPQSFSRSTLGGWIATRAGGHFATGETHIEDFVESVRMVAPAGLIETRRLPASGAGPSPDRLVAGSEGILGVITSAWVRVMGRPVFRARCSYAFPTFEDGTEALRLLVQSGLRPSNCRVVDAAEALINQAGDGSHAVMLVAFESAGYPVASLARAASELLEGAGGTSEADWQLIEGRPGAVGASSRGGDGRSGGGGHGGGDKEGGRGRSAGGGAPGTSGTSGRWRDSFIRAPYLRDAMVRLGALVETFETAVTWDRFSRLHASVTEAVEQELKACGAEPAVVTCRITHAYSDGPAPYFTVVARAPRGREVECWDRVKYAASHAVSAGGGTITHHHAVGRVHSAHYGEEAPRLFLAGVRSVKAVLDPEGILNPGVLLGPSALEPSVTGSR